jgi:hypothetical protein
VLVSEKRDLAATRRFFTQALNHCTHPSTVTTDRALAYPRVLDELVSAACRITEQYGNNLVEADHGRLKARLRSMRHGHDPAAAEEAGRDALVELAAGEASEDRRRCGSPGMAGVRCAALAVGDVQVLHRPGTDRQGHRRGRALPGAATERDSAVL